jgi:pyridoxal phosphate enzyme (YggS family)
MPEIARNYAALMERLQKALKASGRPNDSVTFMAVTKFQSEVHIREAAALGLKHFGESRLQEAQEKLGSLRVLGEWHFIGTLQSNKAKAVTGLFDVIQSVHEMKLAERVAEQAKALGKEQRIFAQVNISGEPQKHGFSLEGAEEELARLGALPNLRLEGLMGMAAASEDPEQARPSFAALWRLRERLGAQGKGLKLSMGMSHDFEAAIKEGSDLVRIGTALFQ